MILICWSYWFFREERPLHVPTDKEVHTINFQLKPTSVEIQILHESKLYHSYALDRTRPVEEVKIMISSLYHTIPVMFEGRELIFKCLIRSFTGDETSPHDFQKLRLNSKNVDKAKQFVQTTKGRKLMIGKVSSPVIPIQHNQAVGYNSDKPQFDNMYEQLRSAGGFGFIYHCIIQVAQHMENVSILWKFQKILNDEPLPDELCKLLSSYLEFFSVRDGRFTRIEAIQMTSLLLRYKGGAAEMNFLPVSNFVLIILNREFQKSLNRYSSPLNITDEVILWKEFLSESMYWEHHLKDFYLVVVAFNRTSPSVHSDTFLRLILEVKAFPTASYYHKCSDCCKDNP